MNRQDKARAKAIAAAYKAEESVAKAADRAYARAVDRAHSLAEAETAWTHTKAAKLARAINTDTFAGERAAAAAVRTHDRFIANYLKNKARKRK